MITKNIRGKLVCVCLALFPLMVALFLFFHNVEKDLSPQDIKYIDKIFDENNLDVSSVNEKNNYKEQISIILKIQQAAFNTAPKTGLIPVRSPREPKDFYYADGAYCGDRSRFMEKAFRYLGFPVRYATIMRDIPDKNIIQVLLSKGGKEVRTHALIEVKTAKGWIVVDSRKQWISETTSNQPIALKQLQQKNATHYQWSKASSEEPWFLLTEDFHILYGLYSRHGLFYPPYTPYVPDVNWYEFLQNF